MAVEIAYSKLRKGRVSRGDSQMELRVGSDASMDFSGSGISTKRWFELLVMIGEVFNELENA